METPLGEYSLGEEITHAVTHGIGALLAIAGLVVLVAHAAVNGTTMSVVGCSIYGATLFLLYLASTVYHAVPPRSARAKLLLQRLDHAAIYLLIAGTYTPFTLLALSGTTGIGLLAVVWALAMIGLVLTMTPFGRRARTATDVAGARAPETRSKVPRRWYERVSLGLYLAMGWIGVVAAKQFVEALPWTALALLLAGGLSYTVGVVFYARARKWSHAVWHGFVLAGSGLHFFALLSAVAR
ncbi:MAG: hemolysin III family protein [Deltaproteobacteria bacterium]|nr:hemolysin III family protein [Deltaproteobacteria bacterium]